jgi:hypothetical protein
MPVLHLHKRYQSIVQTSEGREGGVTVVVQGSYGLPDDGVSDF